MSSQRVLELPKNVEQLVLDCFDEEQYSAGLAFLAEILGPPVVPSHELLEHLIVISISKATYRKSNTDRTLSRTAKRNKLQQPLLPEIFYEDVEAARTLLLLHLQRVEFAKRFLSVLPAGYKTNNRRSVRAAPRRISPQRRQSSSISPEADQTSPTAIAAEQLFSSADHRTVFDLMHHLVQDSEKRKPAKHESVRLSNKDKSRDTSLTDGSTAAEDDFLSRIDLFRKESQSLQFVDPTLAEDLQSLRHRQAALDDPSVWKLLELLNTAWHTQRSAGQQIHLAAQQRSNEEVGTVLDLIFAGLGVNDRHDDVVRRPSEADEALKHKTALSLMDHCVQLVHDGVIHRGAMVRGIVDRLHLVSLPSINAMREHSQRRNHQREPETTPLLAEAIILYLKFDIHHSESASSDDDDDYYDDDDDAIKGTRLSRTSLILSHDFLLQELNSTQQGASISKDINPDKATASKLQSATKEAVAMYTLARRLALLLLFRRLTISTSHKARHTQTYNRHLAELSRQLDMTSNSHRQKRSSQSFAADLLGDSFSDDDEDDEEEKEHRRQHAPRKRLKTLSHTKEKGSASEQTQVAELLQWLHLRTRELKSGVQEYLKASR